MGPPQEFDEFNPNNPYTALALLGMRVDNLGKEKEALERDLESERKDRSELEKRVAAMERSFQRGAGILMVLPILGTVVGIFLAYGKAIFAPWTGKEKKARPRNQQNGRAGGLRALPLINTKCCIS